MATHQVAAHVTNNTMLDRVVQFASPVTGRYLRYVANTVVASGTNHGWWSHGIMFELDMWEPGCGPAPTPVALTVVAAVASSAATRSNTDGEFPMDAFDGSATTYWNIANGNFGYTDKWVQGDLGAAKSISKISLDFGAIASRRGTDFTLMVGSDPNFAAGTFTTVGTLTGNSSQTVDVPIAPAATGRWVRLLISATTGAAYTDWSLAEMRIFGENVASTERKLAVSSPTASTSHVPDGRVPAAAFDGRYDNFWHAAAGATLPQWLQADLGSVQQISRAVAYYYAGYALMEDGTQAQAFQIWVGNDPAFPAGSYMVAANLTGGDLGRPAGGPHRTWWRPGRRPIRALCRDRLQGHAVLRRHHVRAGAVEPDRAGQGRPGDHVRGAPRQDVRRHPVRSHCDGRALGQPGDIHCRSNCRLCG